MARAPDGCVVTNFLFVNFFLFIKAILKASPKQQNIVVLAVGANEKPASLTLGNKILIVECLSSIDEDLQEIPITFKLNLLAYLSIEFNSEDSPDTLNIKSISSFERKPNPPCWRSLALNPTAGEPKLDNVLATFKEIIKDLPTPTTTILFFVLLHKLTAFEN